MKNNKVAVLMSIYNGEKYIKEQLDSIFAQKNVNFTLFIRDDGSIDNTLNIINEYRKKYSNIVLIESEENLGPAMSFMKLLEFAYFYNNYDYYSFSDQDDIWLEEKLAKAIEKIKNYDEPTLYCSNQIIFQKNKELSLRFSEIPDFSLIKRLHTNDISGCTCVFNRMLAKNLVESGIPSREILDFRLHDSWIVLFSLVSGQLFYDRNSYIKYRIHDNNFAGLKQLTIWQRIKRRYFTRIQAKNLRSKTAKELLKRCKIKRHEDKELVMKFANYQNSLFDKKRLLKEADSISKISGESKLSLYLKVLLNVF